MPGRGSQCLSPPRLLGRVPAGGRGWDRRACAHSCWDCALFSVAFSGHRKAAPGRPVTERRELEGRAVRGWARAMGGRCQQAFGRSWEEPEAARPQDRLVLPALGQGLLCEPRAQEGRSPTWTACVFAVSSERNFCLVQALVPAVYPGL